MPPHSSVVVADGRVQAAQLRTQPSPLASSPPARPRSAAALPGGLLTVLAGNRFAALATIPEGEAVAAVPARRSAAKPAVTSGAVSKPRSAPARPSSRAEVADSWLAQPPAQLPAQPGVQPPAQLLAQPSAPTTGASRANPSAVREAQHTAWRVKRAAEGRGLPTATGSPAGQLTSLASPAVPSPAAGSAGSPPTSLASPVTPSPAAASERERAMFTKGEGKERKGRKEEPLRPPASPAPTRTSSPHASGRHPSTPAGQQHSSEEQTSGTHCEQAQKSRPGTSKNRNRSASECPPGSLHQPADSTSHTALTSNNLPDAPAAPGAGTAALTLG